MKRLLKPILLALSLGLLTPVVVQAQAQTRAYAPENLRTLSYNDQVRVISLEYSEQSGGRRIPDDQLRFYIDQVNRSNWGFSQIKQDIAQQLSGGVGPTPPTPGGYLRCESTDGRSRTCPTPWQGQSRLVRQLSSTACVEGRTWQSQRGQVYVSGGCRAEFAARVAVQPPPAAGIVTCSSNDDRLKVCPAWLTSYGQPRLSRQLSGKPCIQGQTWGYDGRGLWVSRGCRAEFTSGRHQNQNPGNNYSVTCSSNNDRQTTCAWNASFGRPILVQQLSGTACVEGRNWGYRSNAIWVSGGCRARFGVR